MLAGGLPLRSTQISSNRPSAAEAPPQPGAPPSPEVFAPTILPNEGGTQFLFHDGFTDPSISAVPLFAPEYMGFQVADGAGVMTAHNSGVLTAMYASASAADFVATLKFLVPAPAAGAGYGMVFRSDDAAGGLAHFYLLLVSPTDGNVVLSRWDPAGVEEITRVPYTAGPTGQISMVTRAEGSHFEVEIDGEPLISADDSAPLGAGIFGLAMLSPVDGDLVIFQSLMVEAP